MITKKGFIYGMIYFIMLPLGYQIARRLDMWRTEIKGDINIDGIYTGIYFSLILVAFLASLFIIIMMILNDRIIASCKAGKWIPLIILIINILLSMLPLIDIMPETNNGNISFIYFFSTPYMILIIMLLVFTVANMLHLKWKGKVPK